MCVTRGGDWPFDRFWISAREDSDETDTAAGDATACAAGLCFFFFMAKVDLSEKTCVQDVT